jgi:hypothetical protein
MASDATYDAQMDLMDQLQRIGQKVDRLCRRAGINPEEAGRLPGEDEDPAAPRPVDLITGRPSGDAGHGTRM